jgi:hypothetical protein
MSLVVIRNADDSVKQLIIILSIPMLSLLCGFGARKAQNTAWAARSVFEAVLTPMVRIAIA